MPSVPPPTSNDFKSQLMLSVGFLFMLFPAGMGLSAGNLKTAGLALLCGGLALLTQIQLSAFLKPPRWCQWCFLPGVMVSPVFCTIGLPHPVCVFIPLFSLAWIINTAAWPKPPLWGRFLMLAFLGWAMLSIDRVTPDFGFPRLPSYTFLWVIIALIAPLAIATQSRLRGCARGVVLAELILVFLAISLTPIVLQIVTGFKEVGEPERNFFSLDPLPGFVTVQDVDMEDVIPSDFKRFRDPLVAMRVLDHMNQNLQLHELKKVAGGFDPDQAVFLLQQFGLLLKDRYGFYVPPEVYGPIDVSKNMDPAFLPVVETLARHTSLDISDPSLRTSLAADSDIPATTKAFRTMMLRMRGLNLVDTVPGNASVFRMTPQARHRLETGLFPRHILFAATHSSATSSSRIHHADYAPEWSLPFEDIRHELIQLVDAGVLEIDDTPSWYPYRPKNLNTWPVTLSAALAWLGLLLAGTATPLPRSQRIKLACFALGMVTVHAVSTLPGLEIPLVHQAVWATLWLPASALLLGNSMR